MAYDLTIKLVDAQGDPDTGQTVALQPVWKSYPTGAVSAPELKKGQVSTGIYRATALARGTYWIYRNGVRRGMVQHQPRVTYRARDIAITGTAGAPQTIAYAALTDEVTGDPLPTTFVKPAIFFSQRADRGVYLTEAPGATSFKVAMSASGAVGDVAVDILIEEGQDES